MFKPLFALLCSLVVHQVAAAQVPPITAGYGANGSFSVIDEKFASPLFKEENVHVFRPAEASTPAPVIFFAPGYSTTDPVGYRALINHIVSRGYVVVFSPFQIIAGDGSVYEKRYDTIFAGFEEAALRYARYLDLTRVGFIGHSYGGGASFAMMRRGAVGKGWGRNGLFLFVMAPWYVYEITTKQLLDFPAHAKLIVQVYETDATNDHRIAKEVFERVGLSQQEKDFVMLRDDEYQGCKLDAGHGAPSGNNPDALDYYGIWRLFDALADCSLNDSPAGRRVALGGGSAEQRFMGLWPAAGGSAGRPVKELLAGECVPITRASSSFFFRYDQTIHDLSSVSAASFRAPVAPGSLATIFGKMLADAAASAGGVSTVIDKTSLKIRDSACYETFAQLLYVAPGQINYVLPGELANGAATLIAYNKSGAVSLGTVEINRVAPGVFTANSNGQGAAAAIALRVKANGAQQFEPTARYDETARRFVTAPIELGNANEQVFLILFGTGWRNRSSLAALTATIGGAPVEALFAGAQGSLFGLDQLNLRLPPTLAGRGEVEVVVRVENQTANTVKVNFK
jgi:uncharacterized protein (TIGR03437 family)